MPYLRNISVLMIAVLLCGVAVAGTDDKSSVRLNGKRLDHHQNQPDHHRQSRKMAERTDSKHYRNSHRHGPHCHHGWRQRRHPVHHNSHFDHHPHYRREPGYWHDFHRHSGGYYSGYRHRYYNGYNYYFNHGGFYFPGYGHIRHGHRHSHHCPGWHYETFASMLLLGLIFSD